MNLLADLQGINISKELIYEWGLRISKIFWRICRQSVETFISFFVATI